MDRAQKTEIIGDVRSALQGAGLVILTDFKGSTVAEMETVRRTVGETGASFRVVKNTLSRIAVKETELEGLEGYFRGNTGILLSGDDPISAAKAFRSLRKDNEKLEAKAGFFEGTVLTAQEVDAVADLMGREELLSKLLATITESPRQILRVIQGPARNLVNVLNNYADKLEEGA